MLFRIEHLTKLLLIVQLLSLTSSSNGTSRSASSSNPLRIVGEIQGTPGLTEPLAAHDLFYQSLQQMQAKREHARKIQTNNERSSKTIQKHIYYIIDGLKNLQAALDKAETPHGNAEILQHMKEIRAQIQDHVECLVEKIDQCSEVFNDDRLINEAFIITMQQEYNSIFTQVNQEIVKLQRPLRPHELTSSINESSLISQPIVAYKGQNTLDLATPSDLVHYLDASLQKFRHKQEIASRLRTNNHELSKSIQKDFFPLVSELRRLKTALDKDETSQYTTETRAKIEAHVKCLVEKINQCSEVFDNYKTIDNSLTITIVQEFKHLQSMANAYIEQKQPLKAAATAETNSQKRTPQRSEGGSSK